MFCWQDFYKICMCRFITKKGLWKLITNITYKPLAVLFIKDSMWSCPTVFVRSYVILVCHFRCMFLGFYGTKVSCDSLQVFVTVKIRRWSSRKSLSICPSWAYCGRSDVRLHARKEKCLYASFCLICSIAFRWVYSFDNIFTSL